MATKVTKSSLSRSKARRWRLFRCMRTSYGRSSREKSPMRERWVDRLSAIHFFRTSAWATRLNPKQRFQRAFVPTTALAKQADFDEVTMRLTFTDGRVLSVPLNWFPLLRDATPQQRANYEIGGGGVSLHWPDVDKDLSIAGLMAGVDRNAG